METWMVVMAMIACKVNIVADWRSAFIAGQYWSWWHRAKRSRDGSGLVCAPTGGMSQIMLQMSQSNRAAPGVAFMKPKCLFKTLSNIIPVVKWKLFQMCIIPQVSPLYWFPLYSPWTLKSDKHNSALLTPFLTKLAHRTCYLLCSWSTQLIDR